MCLKSQEVLDNSTVTLFGVRLQGPCDKAKDEFYPCKVLCISDSKNQIISL